jgi:hypothetical protein
MILIIGLVPYRLIKPTLKTCDCEGYDLHFSPEFFGL